MDRLMHDVSWQAALNVMEMISPLIPKGQSKETFFEIHNRIEAAFQYYELQRDQQLHRRKPSKK